MSENFKYNMYHFLGFVTYGIVLFSSVFIWKWHFERENSRGYQFDLQRNDDQQISTWGHELYGYYNWLM